MKVYSVEQIYAMLEQQVVEALNLEAEKIRASMEKYIDEVIYKSYTEKVYKRINQFKESATIEPAQKIDGEWYVEIYIPDTEHDPSNWKGKNRTLSEIAKWFADGDGYGRNGVKYDVIEETRKEYDDTSKAFNDIYNYLKRQFNVYK